MGSKVKNKIRKYSELNEGENRVCGTLEKNLQH